MPTPSEPRPSGAKMPRRPWILRWPTPATNAEVIHVKL